MNNIIENEENKTILSGKENNIAEGNTKIISKIIYPLIFLIIVSAGTAIYDLHGRVSTLESEHKIFKSALDDRIDSSALSKYGKKIKSLANDSIISYYKLAFKADSIEDNFRKVKIYENDVDDLLDIAFDSKTQDDVFRDVLRILEDIFKKNKSNEIPRNLIELIKGDSERSMWIKNSPERRSMIIGSMRYIEHFDAINAIRPFLKDSSVNAKVMIAAIKFVKDSFDYHSVDQLLKLAIHPDFEIKTDALKALARIKPDCKELKDWIVNFKKNISTQTELKEISTALSIAAELIKGTKSTNTKTNLFEFRKETAKDLIKTVVNNNVRFALLPGFYLRGKAESIRLSYLDNRGSYWHATPYIFTEQRCKIIKEIIQESIKSQNIKEICNYVDAFSIYNDSFELYSLDRVSTVILNFNKDSGILAENKQIITKETTQRGCALKVTGENKLMAVWLDPIGSRLTGIVKKFINPDEINVSLSIDREFISLVD